MSDKLEQVTEVSQNSNLVLGQEMDMKVTHTYNDSGYSGLRWLGSCT